MKRILGALFVVLAATVSALSQDPKTPTYHGDVEQIFQRRCQVCHRPDAIGPFDLLTYRDALANSEMIEEVVANRRMPPWHAHPSTGPFSNRRSLPEGERQTILAWVKAGTLRGDPAKAPSPATFADPDDWTLGEPDAVIQLPRAFTVPAEGAVEYQYYEVGTDLDADKWVTSWEVKVTAPDVVHHVLVFVVYPNRADSPPVRGGLKGYFCSYLPGESLEPFALGSAKFLPKGARLRFQVHYTPDGEPHQNTIRLGLKFASKDSQPRRARTIALATTRFLIPPGASEHTVRARYRFKRDTLLMGLTPHMHLRGKSFSYLLIYPDGKTKRVLWVPKWDFNWQNTYRLETPLFVPEGSRMLGVATFDNSAKNRANPNPNVSVRFGEQTWDEMMIGYMDVVDATPEERTVWEEARDKPQSF